MPRLATLLAPGARRAWGAVAFAFLMASAHAPADAKKPPRAKSEPEVSDFSDEGLSKRFQIPLSEVGYLVVDAKTGQVLEQHQPKEPFVPASTIKVASTLAALIVLGADHRFATEVATTATLRGGTLEGDLYLKGGGDPMLTSDDFEAIAQQLKAKGIARVSGRFLYDSSAYATASAIDDEYEESASYNPGIAALSVNFNVLQLKWERARKGPTQFRFVAQTDNHEIDVGYLKAAPAQAASTGPYGLAYRVDGGTPTWLVIPSRRAKGEIRVPVKQPGFNAAYIFRRAAEKHGISLPEPTPGLVPERASVLARHVSKPLPELVQRTQRFSNNMAAELLGLAAARKLTGKPLDIAGAAAVLGDWLRQNIAGADWQGLVLRNSSGLTKDSRITPEQMVAILRHARNLAIGERAYADLLRNYHVGKIEAEEEYGAAEGARPNRGSRERGERGKTVEIKAKTGTVNYSRGVVGYLRSSRGRELVFAIFVSDYKQREFMQKQGQAWREPPPRRWLSQSGGLQRAVVRRWAERF